jgi:predicted O-methyltransferase YrrM
MATLLDKSKENHILEIGCYEGLSSVFFADNFINIEGPVDSTLTCVDPFLNIDNNDHGYLLQNGEELNFDYNISKCKNTKKITVHKMTADDFFMLAALAALAFNFIYIDGCQEPDFIKRDMENAFRVLKKGGIMWMNGYDDGGYGGDGSYKGGCDVIKKVMDDFLDKYAGQYVVVHKGYQLAIRKNNE